LREDSRFSAANSRSRTNVQGVLEYTEPEACLASEIIFMESTVYESVNRRVLYMNLCLFFN